MQIRFNKQSITYRLCPEYKRIEDNTKIPVYLFFFSLMIHYRDVNPRLVNVVWPKPHNQTHYAPKCHQNEHVSS